MTHRAPGGVTGALFQRRPGWRRAPGSADPPGPPIRIQQGPDQSTGNVLWHAGQIISASSGLTFVRQRHRGQTA